MGIIDEVDAALVTAIRGADRAPRDLQYLIVLNSDARNEFMHDMAGRRDIVQRQVGVMSAKYRGAILAVSHDDNMPRVTIFSRLVASK